ncbi:hypothetical protein HPB47_013263 [Ixodes persulcatus]|uniref:Uncharacterized protein n=1 Tax=Ixodes persulcatus TaxID=34615 RepID=A0AC60R1G5_IXOPE|nr:hypothetical protein HPB47_013263 [Ixodes persulcatus]
MPTGAPFAGPTRDTKKGRNDKRRQARRTARLGKRVRPVALTPERLPAAVTLDNSAKLPSPRGFGDYGNAVGSRGPSTGPSYAAKSAAPAAATTTATGRRPTDTRTATKVHLSVTLPATAPGVPTRPQAAGPHQGSLLIVYGLNSNKMNAEKLFNLLCLHGNVVNCPPSSLTARPPSRTSWATAITVSPILRRPPRTASSRLCIVTTPSSSNTTNQRAQPRSWTEKGGEGGKFVGFAAHHRAKELALGARRVRRGLLPHLAGLGHVWLLKLKTPEAKGKLLQAGELQVKERRCLVIDPYRWEIKVKLHWDTYHVRVHTVHRAFDPYGEMKDVAWKV